MSEASASGPIVRKRVHSQSPAVRAILFDRDGTLIEDVPYNGDPALVVVKPGVRQALEECRRAGVLLGMVTNQSGVARGLITEADVWSIAEELERHVGPVDVWCVCPHGPWDSCSCRKPQPGLILAAAGALRVDLRQCVVIGDQETDVRAATAAGVHGILLPADRGLRNREVLPSETPIELAVAKALKYESHAGTSDMGLPGVSAGDDRVNS